jgi:hypothetical protein
VQAQAFAGTAAFSSSDLTASAPSRVCVTGLKPICYEVGGGAFTAALPVDYGLVCDATAAGTMQYTDVSSGVVVSKPVTWTGPCVTPTTTTLSIPSTVDTGWTAAVNPAGVTAGSTVVTSGTVTIAVNGVSFCSYTAGASSGCNLAGLPQDWIYSMTQSNPDATGASAECIEEQPAAAGLPLADFGSVTFTGCKAAADNGPAMPIWDYPYNADDMASGSTQQAVVSPLSDDGTQFTVTWLHG